MKVHLFLILIMAVCHRGISQWDSLNFLEKDIYKKEIGMFSNRILYSGSDSIFEKLYSEFDLYILETHKLDSFDLQFEGRGIVIGMNFTSINPQNHIFDINDSIRRIDGMEFYSDYYVDTPYLAIDSIFCIKKSNGINIPKDSYYDLFDPILFDHNNNVGVGVYQSKDEERIYLYFMGYNDGYEATLILDQGKYIGRLLFD